MLNHYPDEMMPVGYVNKVHSLDQFPRGVKMSRWRPPKNNTGAVFVFQSARADCYGRERISSRYGGPVAEHCLGRNVSLERFSQVTKDLGKVVMTQMLETVSTRSVMDIVNKSYSHLFGLTVAEVDMVARHVDNWSILRKCCGCQQSLQNRQRWAV